MILAEQTLSDLGLIVTAVGGVVAAWALIQARRTDKKSATREDVQQVIDAQELMLGRYERDNDILRGRNEALHDTVNRVLAQGAEMKVKHERCERDLNALGDRLRLAEAKILELGG